MDYSFAFAPSGLLRSAELRADGVARRMVGARTIVLWRGKLLVDGAQNPCAVGLDHPALVDCREESIFIGLTSEGPRFAADLTLWQPPEDATTIGQFIDTSPQTHPGFPDAHFAELRAIMADLDRDSAEIAATARALTGWHASHRFCANCGAVSVVMQSGWQRNCPSCAAQHFPRTDPVVIMAITHGDRLLLGRGPTWPERMYSLLAGFVEPGESIEAAVRRETKEEAGIEVGVVRYIASQPWPFPMSLMFGCHGEALTADISRDDAELADALWVSKTEVMAILAGDHPDIAQPRKGAIAGYLIAAWAADRLEGLRHYLPAKVAPA